MELSEITTILNIVAVVIVLYFTNRMLRAASIYNWNPGDSSVQDPQKIKVLQSIVIIAFVGLAAAAVNVFFG